MLVKLEGPFKIKYEGNFSCVTTETIKAYIGFGKGGQYVPDLALDELNRYLRLRSVVFQLTANISGLSSSTAEDHSSPSAAVSEKVVSFVSASCPQHGT